MLGFELFGVELNAAILTGIGAFLAGAGSLLSGLAAYRLARRNNKKEGNEPSQ